MPADLTTLLARFLTALYSGAPSIGPNGELTVSSSAVASTVPYVGPAGSNSAASLNFGTMTANTGLFDVGSQTLGYTVSGTKVFQVGATNVDLATDSMLLRFGSSSDVSFSRQSAGTPVINGSTATPAGGSTGLRLVFGSTAGFGIYVGSGLPTVSAAQGSIYLRSDGSSSSTRMYVNSTGSTAWVAVTTAT